MVIQEKTKHHQELHVTTFRNAENLPLRKLRSPILCFEPKQGTRYGTRTSGERAASEPAQGVLYSRNETIPPKPVCTAPLQDMRQAGTQTPSRSPGEMQLLCRAGNQGCCTLNGTMQSPADRTRKSGVQQPHAKSLKGCSWRKDKCCWQLGACIRESWNQENVKKQSMNPIRSLIRDCFLHVSCGLLDHCTASSPAA